MRFTMEQAARMLAADRVLADPSDDAIVLAAVELSLGFWPEGGVTPEAWDAIVAAYNAQEDEDGA